MTSGTRSSKDDNGKAIRDKFGKGGPPGWRKDGLSKVKLEPEFGKIPMDKGVISMRRFGNPDSAGSQFIINMSDMKDEMEGTLNMRQESGPWRRPSLSPHCLPTWLVSYAAPCPSPCLSLAQRDSAIQSYTLPPWEHCQLRASIPKP